MKKQNMIELVVGKPWFDSLVQPISPVQMMSEIFSLRCFLEDDMRNKGTWKLAIEFKNL